MTARQRLAELRDQVVRKIVITLVTYEGGLRIQPATIERIRAIVIDALLAARQILEMYSDKPDSPTEDELADTRPMRTRPPPPPKRDT